MRACDNLPAVCGIKGNVKVQLFDSETNELQFEVEKANMMFPKELAVNFSKMLIESMMYRVGGPYANGFTDAGSNYKWSNETTLFKSLFRALYLSPDDTEVVEDESSSVESVVGFADTWGPYGGTNNFRGTINRAESLFVSDDKKIRFVFDFPTNAANDTFQSVGFCFSWRYFETNEIYVGKMLCGERLVAKKYDSFKSPYDNNLLCTYGFSGCVELPSGDMLFILADTYSGYEVKRWSVTTKLVVNSGYLSDMSGVTIQAASNFSIYLDDANLYTCIRYGSNYVIRKYSLSSLDSNVQASAIAEYTISTNFGSQHMYGFCIDGANAYFYSASNTVDSAVGNPFNNYIYKVQLSNGAILQRIALNLYDSQEWRNSQNCGLVKLKVRSDGKLFMVCRSAASYHFMFLLFDLSSAEEISRDLMYAGNSSMFNYGVFNLIGDEILFFNFSGSYLTDMTSWGTNLLGIFYVVPRGSKMSRVLLPNPVAKTNTQVLKITYDLIFPDGIV